MGKWVVLGVSIGKEIKVENHFKRKSYGCVDRVWIPRFTKNDSKGLVVSGYVFVRVNIKLFSPEKLERVPYSNGLIGRVGCFLINDEEVKEFRDSIKSSEMGYVNRIVTFKKGETVKIRGKLFNNLWGKVLQVNRKKGRCKIGIKTSHGLLRVDLALTDLDSSGEIT